MHLLVIVLIILADQFSKYLALNFWRKSGENEVRKRLITFKIVKNSGAALGIFENRKKLLMTISIILLTSVTYFLIYSIRNKNSFTFTLTIVFILGGGLSNFIDRLRTKYVIDFFMFNINNSPVFNLADIFILIGTIALQLMILLDI